MDLFDLVMNELSSTVTNRDKELQKLRTRKGEHRYKDNRLGVCVDGNEVAIPVFSGKEEELTFAKRVANYYDCDFKIYNHGNAPVNGKYECRIFIK